MYHVLPKILIVLCSPGRTQSPPDGCMQWMAVISADIAQLQGTEWIIVQSRHWKSGETNCSGLCVSLFIISHFPFCNELPDEPDLIDYWGELRQIR